MKVWDWTNHWLQQGPLSGSASERHLHTYEKFRRFFSNLLPQTSSRVPAFCPFRAHISAKTSAWISGFTWLASSWPFVKKDHMPQGPSGHLLKRAGCSSPAFPPVHKEALWCTCMSGGRGGGALWETAAPPRLAAHAPLWASVSSSTTEALPT